MTTDQAINRILRAKTAKELFTDPRDFKRLARLVYPDLVPPRLKKRAEEAMRKLNEFNEQANGKGPKIKIGSWTIDGPLAKGDVADLYAVTGESGREAVLKITRSPKDNDLIKAEAVALKKLWGPAPDDGFKKYLPELLDSFAGSGRQANVLSMATGRYSLREILNWYPNGLDFRHVVWMMNRLLSVLGYAAQQGIVHGAVFPEHLLYHPEEHGLTMIDWCYSVNGGTPLKAVATNHKTHCPKEVFDKRPATTALDIYQAGRTMLLAAERVPKGFTSFFEWCMAPSPSSRSQDPWAAQEIWEKMARAQYGPPRYLKLETKIN